MARSKSVKFVVTPETQKMDKYNSPYPVPGWDISAKEARLSYENEDNLSNFVNDKPVDKPLEVKKNVLVIPYRGSDREFLVKKTEASLLLDKMKDIYTFLMENDADFRERETLKEAA